MKIIVGLGNPGRDYAATRHNIGFVVLDRLAESPQAGRLQQRARAEIVDLATEAGKVLLVKPQTFMNLSGQPVRQLMDFYKLSTEALLVVCDDMNLPLGKLRFRARGTHGGHNGLRNIQQHLNTTDYARLRIGVGAPERDAVKHVLGPFRASERPVMEEAIRHAAQSVGVWIEQGIETCMNRYNA